MWNQPYYQSMYSAKRRSPIWPNTFDFKNSIACSYQIHSWEIERKIQTLEISRAMLINHQVDWGSEEPSESVSILALKNCFGWP